jgi:DNA replication protein DnaC
MKNEKFIRKPVTQFTYGKFIQKFQEFGNELIEGYYNIDINNEQVINIIINYFTYSAQSRLYLEKGIILSGEVGTGKDTLFDILNAIFSMHQLPTIRAVHAIEISDLYMNSNIEEINKYKKYYRHLLIRDVGTEPVEVINYGNKVRPLEELLLVRYEKFRTLGFITHITTNLTFEELMERFGDRMKSRFREMFNFLELPGPERRQAT